MINFYKLECSTEKEEIGWYPQLKSLWIASTDYWGPESYTNTPLEGRIGFDIVFPKFDLEENAKLTDYVSTGALTGDFFVISDRLLTIFQGFKMDEYQHFPIEVGTPDGSVSYNIIYFPFPRTNDIIDWRSSIFKRMLPNGEVAIEFFENARSYNLAKNIHELQAEKLVIHAPKLALFDIFRLKWYKSGIYISERLKLAMEESRITGVRFEEAEWLSMDF